MKSERKLKYGLWIFLIIILSVVACTPSTPIPIHPTVIPNLPQTPTMLVQNAKASPLTNDMIRNMVYVLPLNGNAVQMVDGEYSGQPTGALESIRAKILEPIAFGDLNGDGVEDAAVVIGESGPAGGNGFFPSLITILNQNGKPIQSFSAKISGNANIDNLTIMDGTIVVNARVVGPKDPMARPSKPQVLTYQFTQDALFLISTQE